MSPEQIHVDYQQAALSATAMRRNLTGRSANWGQLIANSQAVLGAFSNSDYARNGDHTVLYDEDNAAPLIAAARTLDSAADTIPEDELSEDARFRIRILSSLAYSMYGNFPSASAVMKKFQTQRAALVAGANTGTLDRFTQNIASAPRRDA